MKTFSMTDTGIRREMNQDYLFACDTPVGNLPNLYIVADGMGGHKAGEYASRYTVERVTASVARSTETEPVTILNEAIEKANKMLIEESKEDETKRGMGTTIVAATITDHKMVVANVGDSRLYVIDNGIRQITRDHSLVEEMVRLGEMDEAQAKAHPDKNIITRAVGAANMVEVDFFEIELHDGDSVLLCSDGLTNMIDDEDIYRIVSENEDVEQQVRTLIETANQNGGKDNITAIIIKLLSDEVKEC